jgi:hypothetical protein
MDEALRCATLDAVRDANALNNMLQSVYSQHATQK